MWGSFNRQSKLASQRKARPEGSRPKTRAVPQEQAPPRDSKQKKNTLMKRKSEGDRQANASPMCLPTRGRSTSPKRASRPSIFCPSSVAKKPHQFIPLDDDSITTNHWNDINNPTTTTPTSSRHYSQIWLGHEKKKREASARRKSIEGQTSGGSEMKLEEADSSKFPTNQHESLRKHRTSFSEPSIFQEERNQLAKALHQDPSVSSNSAEAESAGDGAGAEQHKNESPRRHLHVGDFDVTSCNNSAVSNGLPQSPHRDGIMRRPDQSETAKEETKDDTRTMSTSSNTSSATEHKKVTFCSSKHSSPAPLLPTSNIEPCYPIHLEDDEDLPLGSTKPLFVNANIFRPDLEIYDDIRRDGDPVPANDKKDDPSEETPYCCEEKKELDYEYTKKVTFQKQALFLPEDIEFYKEWIHQPMCKSEKIAENTSFDEHLAQLHLKEKDDLGRRCDSAPQGCNGRNEVRGPNEILITKQNTTFSLDESNPISEITVASSQELLYPIAEEKETANEQGEDSFRKEKCLVFYHQPSTKTEAINQQAAGDNTSNVKNMVVRLEALNRIEAHAENAGFKDFLPIQEQKKREANLRLRMVNGISEDFFSDGDEALQFLNAYSHSFDN